MTASYQTKDGADATALLASTVDALAHTVTGSGVGLPRPSNAVQLVLNVTAASAAGGDTLDVKVQTLIDGVTWVDVCYFTQVLGSGGAKIHIAKLLASTVQAMFLNAVLTAGNIRHLFGDSWRVVYTTVGTGSFTFGVTATPM